ncbi:MAG: hypothetical protein AAF244_04770 [Pseudomonadota bacterium]
MAKNGYKDDALEALALAVKLLEHVSNVPEPLRQYLIEGLNELQNADDKNLPHAFYLKLKGSQRRPCKEIEDKNFAYAVRVHQHKYYDKSGQERKKPLSDLIAVQDVALDVDLEEGNIKSKDSTIKKAYEAHKHNIEK